MDHIVCNDRMVKVYILLVTVGWIQADYPDCYVCTIFNRGECCERDNQRCCSLQQRNDLECPSNASRAAPECKQYRCLADGQCPKGYKCCPSPERVCIPNGHLLPPSAMPPSLQCPLSLSAFILNSLPPCGHHDNCPSLHTCCPLPTGFNSGCCIHGTYKGKTTSIDVTTAISTNDSTIGTFSSNVTNGTFSSNVTSGTFNSNHVTTVRSIETTTMLNTSTTAILNDPMATTQVKS